MSYPSMIARSLFLFIIMLVQLTDNEHVNVFNILGSLFVISAL